MATLRADATARASPKADTRPTISRSSCIVPLLDTRRFAQLAAALVICSTSEPSIATTLQTQNTNVVNVAASLQDTGVSETTQSSPPPLMMSGMTAKNFDPIRYAGRWFEVASLKRGFAGQGQEDCHCTQGVYRFDEANRAIQVDTFCVHGSPDGYVTGIRGKVQCIGDTTDLKSVENELERAEMIKEKCFLRFPTLPFIPKEPYDVLATDYDNYALVSGAKDTSFVQIYSRTPNPGREFIDKWKSYLADLGYDESAIRDTPQDCQDMSMNQLMAMMAAPGMEEVMTNTFNPSLGLTKDVQLDPFTSLVETFKQLIKLYFS